MKIRYLDGQRLYNAFLVGGNSVIQDQKYLNKINVFPVPDSDTGTNLASTMRSIAEGAVPVRSFHTTLSSIADAALSGARGNSGLIFAQFLYGINEEIKNGNQISTQAFGEAVKKAVLYAYESIVSPVEGTMLTVMKDWAESIYRERSRKVDFVDLLSYSLQIAKTSLRETPKKLAVLAKAGVVDAGAKGFVDFLEGITNFIKKGRLKSVSKPEVLWEDSEFSVHADRESIEHRYCTEALLAGKEMDIEKLREEIRPFGSSAIIAGSQKKSRIHIHTDNPADLFFRLKDYGSITQLKVDDMQKQYEVSHKRKSKIGLVTDSSCDLPQNIIDEHQIQVIPFYLSFGDTLFLDKVTITPEKFYTLLRTHREHPKSSQPSPKSVQSLFSFLASHYESLIVIHISDKLSGAFRLSKEASSVIKNKKISLINSRHLSASLGLIVLRIAEAIKEGIEHEELVKLAEEWISKTKIFVDIQTLKYMVRGGRVSPLKGLLAKILNLKPIISLDSEGKATGFGKSFSRKANMKKIIQIVKNLSSKGEIWNYALVHAQSLDRARMYASKLEDALHKKPAYIIDISPVIGVHNGIGAVGISLMFK
ncbi:MAG: DegV family EDD domain-containing protein [Candidatus Aminicenantes bacterium]|nr:DegV family EDD domain-containing protein [Candidatus Aminicenantes bacterium]